MKQKLAIIGAGASGLSLACSIDTSRYEVTIFEKGKRLGSKLLVAGKGGFNLSHSEPLNDLTDRYYPPSFLNESLNYFSNKDLQKFFKDIGVNTFVGSSKRIFPEKPQKPAEVLGALTRKVEKNNVKIVTNAKWIAQELQNGKIQLHFTKKVENFDFDFVVYALGGASWKVTGSDGKWIDHFSSLKIPVTEFQPSNCAVQVNWPDSIKEKLAGKPIKNIAVNFKDKRLKGELMITEFGLEGSPVYALSRFFRNDLKQNGHSEIMIDFKPDLDKAAILDRIGRKPAKNWTAHLIKKLKISKQCIALLKFQTNKEAFNDIETVAALIKSFPITITGLAEIDEAISTVGGVMLNTVDKNFELKTHKNTFAIGEMLDWDAPTGGYLIQGCMSMGQYLANYLNNLSVPKN